MALSPGTLSSEMDNEIQNEDTEAAARASWATAWTNYFYNAAAGAVPVTPGSLASAQNAMSSGMTGLSVTGALAIQTGITAFWATMVGTPTAIFAGSTLITPPPTLAAITAALLPVFLANAVPGVTKTQALTAIATVLHASGGLGGTATFPGPVVLAIL